ncbi:hypothetical protein GJU39_03690 [Pedobacter petrophilus]|uniref:Peptidase M56 domain-containing protein n=1 Tax=Pedobacter petrophilus TaxID=1908241 RepID=A0A7K0FV05_9SPHI|nr:M56 family metallopeptidase [Pedobacter petrophilus]MRX75182.1 hypothetical protein [Pedobacter petrophilus]
MNLICYLLEANLYLIIFYGFYKLFLHKETFYTLNRYFLILSTLMAFTIPFFQLGFLQTNGVESQIMINQKTEASTSILTIDQIIFIIYSLLAIFFLSRLAWRFKNLFRLLKRSNVRIENDVTIIELKNTKSAFSFFNLLFIDPELPHINTIMHHEMTHIRQKHSLDVLFLEIIGSLNWFNPIIYWLKNDIKLLHEYLADEETTGKGIEKYEYAMFLIQNSYGNQSIQLTNQIFNSSILKRRINMLNQKKSAKWARLRLLLVLPVTGALLCASTMAFTKNYGVVDLYPKKSAGLTITLQDTTRKKNVKQIKIAPVPTAPETKTKGSKQVPPPPPRPPLKPNFKLPKSPNTPSLPPPPPVEPKGKAKESRSIIKPAKDAKTVGKPEELTIKIIEPLQIKSPAKKEVVYVEVLPKS